MSTPKLTRQEFLSGLGGLALGGLALGADPFFEAWALDPKRLPLRLTRTDCLDATMSRIRSLSLDAKGQIYAAGDEGVRLLGPDGKLSQTYEVSGPATCVAVDPEGLVYAGGRTQVEVFDPAGNRVAAWGKEGKGEGELRYVTDITLSGNVAFVADAGNRRVHRFAVNGDFIEDIRGFSLPSAYFDCSLDPQGRLLVTHTGEHRLEVYDSDSEKVASWGEFGAALERFCGCCNPTNIAVFPDGKVATAEKGIPRIKVYDPKGTLLAYLAPEDLGLTTNKADLDAPQPAPGGVLPCHDGWPGMPMVVDAEGRLVVSLPNTRQICFFELRESAESNP